MLKNHYSAWMNENELARAIDAAIRCSGKKAVKIAEACGVSEQAVSKWRRTGRISRRNLQQLSDETGVDLLRAEHGSLSKYLPLDPIPLLTWHQVQWLATKTEQQRMPMDKSVSAPSGDYSDQAFAVRVEDDSMVAPAGGPSFPPGSTIFIEPQAEAKNGSFVIARPDPEKGATFKELVIDGGRYYLKPLNPRYPITEAASVVIIGVVRQMLLTIE